GVMCSSFFSLSLLLSFSSSFSHYGFAILTPSPVISSSSPPNHFLFAIPCCFRLSISPSLPLSLSLSQLVSPPSPPNTFLFSISLFFRPSLSPSLPPSLSLSLSLSHTHTHT